MSEFNTPQAQYPWLGPRGLIQSLCYLGIVMEPGYAWFLLEAIKQSLNLMLRSNIENSGDAEAVEYSLAALLMLANTIAVTLSVDIPEEVTNVIKQLRTQNRSLVSSPSIWLTALATGLMYALVYAISADEAVVWPNYHLKLHLSAWLYYPLAWALAIIMAIVGSNYYLMFNTPKIYHHIHTLIDSLKNYQQTIVSLAKRILLLPEPIITTLLNGINRGISIAIVTKYLVQLLLGLNEGYLYIGLIALTAFAGVIETFFTRSLYALEHFAHPKFSEVSWIELLSIHSLSKSLLLETLQIVIRGVSLGVAIQAGLAATSIANYWLWIIPSMAVGGLTLYSFTARCYAHLCRNVLAGKQQTTTSNDFETLSKAYQSSGIQAGIGIDNVFARIAKIMAFYAFSYGVLDAFGWQLEPLLFYSLATLWSSEVAIPDFLIYQQSILNTVAHIRARNYLERKLNSDEQVLLQSRCCETTPLSCLSYFFSVTRLIKPIVKSSLDYPQDEIKSLLQSKNLTS